MKTGPCSSSPWTPARLGACAGAPAAPPWRRPVPLSAETSAAPGPPRRSA
uniref:Uncharacterized protein n=1 Tax=Anguilla anguilla TaxID=7936 RepID=A0A0E9RL26_ANGAN